MKNRLSSYKEIIELTSAIDTLLASGGSKGFLLLYYSRMIMLLSDTGDEAFFEANFRLHEGPYLDSLKMYGAAGHDPGHTGLILTAAESLKKFSSHNVNQELINQTERIRREKIRLDDVLQGKVTSGPEQAAALLFPVIDTDAGGESLTHLESISVKIIPVNKETRFIIHPTYRSQDPVLGAQVKTSFENALILSSGIFTFPHKEFDVYVTFNSAIGDYSGESFGAALALEMFFELNRLYNKSTDAGAAARMIISGGVDENGQIKPLGKKSTIFKTRAAFYSDADYFIVSPEDEHTAKAELSELQKKFPHRKLKIPGIEDLREITQRRYFVTIKRKSVPKRTAQFLRRNAFAAAITVMLIFTLGLYLAYRTDTNPVDYEFGEGIVKIKNKFGNVIWTAEAKVSTAPVRMGLSHMNLFCRIMDIDGDGKNEVLISEAKIKEGEHRGKTGLVCMRAPDDILWSYCATDTVKSVKEPLIPVEYAIKIIDTVTIDNRKQLYIFIHNNSTFPSAVYALDAKTGKKTGGTLWSSGHICQAGIFDYNSDGKYELFFARRDNGFYQNFLHMAELPLKTGQIRSTDPYRLLDIDYIDLPLTILAPTTDYPHDDIVGGDYLPPLVMGYTTGEDLITFQISHIPYLVNCGFSLKLHKDLINTTITIWGQFRSDRDSLVKAGILPPPYTDTPEYIDFLQKQIKIWKYGKRVR